MTQPVEGIVRAVDGGPLAGVRIVASGVEAAEPAQTLSDRSGHYALPSMRLQTSSATLEQAWLSADELSGYEAGRYVLPTLTVSGQTAHVDIRLQPELTLVDQLDIALTNDDIEYGDDHSRPPRLWPAKVIAMKPTLSGMLEIRAEWSGSAQLAMWAENFLGDLRESSPVSNAPAAMLVAPDEVLRDPRSSTLVIGQPFSLGGLPAPVSVRLTVRPAAAPSF